MSNGHQLPDLSDLVESQRRIEEQLRDLKEFLQETLEAKSAQCSPVAVEGAQEHRLLIETVERTPGSDGARLQADKQPQVGETPGSPQGSRTANNAGGSAPITRTKRKLSQEIVCNHFSSDRSETSEVSISAGVQFSVPCQRVAKKIVRDSRFDYVMGVLIMANTVTLGLEIEFSLEGQGLVDLAVLEYVFLSCFIVEIFLKLVADRLRNFQNCWFLLDLVLVITGLVGAILTTIAAPSLEADNSFVDILSLFQLLRILRLLRLLRTLRSIEQFTELWKMTVGLIGCFKTVLSAMVLVFVTLYFFSCLAVELIYKSSLLQNDPRTSPLVNSHFNSLPKAMLTLVAFANADSIAGIYVPLCTVQPWLGGFFFSLWLILTISLLNLVAAVIVEKSLSHANEDQELQKRFARKRINALIPKIADLFHQLDVNNRGTLEMADLEFSCVSVPSELRSIIQDDRLVDLFDQLDMDGTGDLDEEEFIHGVCHLALSTSSVPIEVTQIIQLLRRQDKQLAKIEERLTRQTRTQGPAQPELEFSAESG